MAVIFCSYNSTAILGFAILQVTLEIYEIIASFNKLYDMLDYFLDYWNWLDATRIGSAILYYHYDQEFKKDGENMNHL
jgi:hypothetical protein